MNWADVRNELLVRTPVAPAELASVTQTGVYAWYDKEGALVPFYPSDFPPVDRSLPLYVGLAAKDSLAGRVVGTHMVSTRRSGLRRSLAALLHEELDLRPGVIAHPKGKFDLMPTRETKLTDWMLDNGLRVTWVTHDAPVLVEKLIIRNLLSPLNYTHATGSPYRASMRRLRVELRTAALN
ncbi:GIY-YIG nuclease family protein [Mycetocola sp. 2940]|uniref:GIY-YIG nuclease family protein n=1 Tax=Mycetocola sp. 2940 TaxID=3156452 RepID=UPI003396A004